MQVADASTYYSSDAPLQDDASQRARGGADEDRGERSSEDKQPIQSATTSRHGVPTLANKRLNKTALKRGGAEERIKT